MLPHLLHLESVTVEPTAKDPHNSRVVYSLIVPKQLCNMGGMFLFLCYISPLTLSRKSAWRRRSTDLRHLYLDCHHCHQP